MVKEFISDKKRTKADKAVNETMHRRVVKVTLCPPAQDALAEARRKGTLNTTGRNEFGENT